MHRPDTRSSQRNAMRSQPGFVLSSVKSTKYDDLLFERSSDVHPHAQAKRKMGRVMQLASFSLAEVTYATGDISYLVQEQAKVASFKVRAKQENVSGVVLPAFEVNKVPGTGTCKIWSQILTR